MGSPRKVDRRNALGWGKTTYLRFPRASDLDEFLSAARRSRRLHHPWVRPATDEEAFSGYLRGARRGIQRRTLICRTEDGAIVGYLNFNVITYYSLQSATLGYAAFEPHAAKGYMRDGLRVGLGYAFGSLKLHRLEANIQISNKRSVRLVKAAGFQLEGYSPRYLEINGRWQDHLRFALLKENWKKAPH